MTEAWCEAGTSTLWLEDVYVIGMPGCHGCRACLAVLLVVGHAEDSRPLTPEHVPGRCDKQTRQVLVM